MTHLELDLHDEVGYLLLICHGTWHIQGCDVATKGVGTMRPESRVGTCHSERLLHFKAHTVDDGKAIPMAPEGQGGGLLLEERTDTLG